MSERVSESLGRPVVAADTAENVGEVKAFVLDRSGRTITQLHIAGRKRSAAMVNWSDLSGFGTDAVMVASHDTFTDSVEERADEMVRGHVEVIGARVLDTDGFEHGVLADLEFDPATGAVIAAIGDGRQWPSDAIRSLGSYALVVESRSAK